MSGVWGRDTARTFGGPARYYGVCVSCTTEMKTLGVMVPSNGKCGLTLQLIAGEDKRGQALLKKQVQRNRWNG